MGYRKLSTTDIHELMRRWRAHQGVRQIARETGIDRKTVRRYIAAAKSFEIERDREREPSHDEIASITHRVQARPPRSPSEAWQQLMPYKEKIAACVDEQQRLRLRAARAMLAGEGIQVTYWTLRRFAIRARMEQSGTGALTERNGARDAPTDGRSTSRPSLDGRDGSDGKSTSRAGLDGSDGKSTSRAALDGNDGKPDPKHGF